ncbi:CRISPR-associated helicase Cas3' [Enterobacillus tribolii]|uniref:CRISPR-associated endonuclease/helicase Cas3 n=1 Tax=Enterobacillus tribolii TaxID=1487935 RepID=A0A370QRY4_9GAMM|nr:CRISPR-associated helicase Cas3' [Enterobacillus tribolii]MBW7983475.1 CRISPR-associated helicase Cas3' [Enterobacillus tribolii]RDK92030.1 CRISPR-associated endonuclease/helicase Cas3 [Enterobacillus tribolii]
MPDYLRYWGKARSDAEQGGDAFHLLAYHCLDVAACGYVMVMENRFGSGDGLEALGFSREDGARWIAWLFAVHDIGKFAGGFQAQYTHNSPDLVRVPAGIVYTLRHDSLGYWLWREQLSQRWLEGDCAILPACDDADCERFLDTMDVWMQVSTGHHGVPPEKGNDAGILAFSAQDIEAARAYLIAIGELFSFSAWPVAWKDKAWRKQLKCQSWQLAGMMTLADWMGSDQARFPFVAKKMPLRAYWQQALATAEALVSSLPPVSCVSDYTGYQALFPFIQQPTPLQRYAAEADISAPGPQLMVLEDVTGAGKTEAAMILTHRLMAQGKASGLYVGLPTMATANAMFERLAKAYRVLFRESDRPSLVLAHGGRHMSQAFRDSVWHEQSDGQTAYGPEDVSAGAECNAWFADSRKKALLAEVGVGTLDQLLMAVMPFRHQSLRLLGIRDKVLLLDEVHAYDAFMIRLLEGLLFFHAAQGGSAIILSATLNASLREKLLGAFAAGAGFARVEPLPQAGYPWVSHLTSQTLQETRIDTRREVQREVAVNWITGIEQGMALIYQAVAAGECICWIRNTVDDAIAVYRQLISAGQIPAADILLFHSRFAFTDRMAIEARALSWFGKEGAADERRGKVLIATQVIEQSVDIDMDNMLTDLAPIDLLIQRAGRLQRHVRKRSGELKTGLPDERAAPVLHVLAPEWQENAQPGWLGETLRGTGYVYADHACLWRTQAILRRQGGIRMPEEARTLVESVYEEGIEAPAGLQGIADGVLGQVLSHRAAAKQNLLLREKGYDRNASDYLWSEMKELSTRLSEESAEVFLAFWGEDGELLPYAGEGAFSWERSKVQVRKRWWEKHAGGFVVPDEELLERFRKQIHRPAAQVLLVSGEDAYYGKAFGLIGGETG